MTFGQVELLADLGECMASDLRFKEGCSIVYQLEEKKKLNRRERRKKNLR